MHSDFFLYRFSLQYPRKKKSSGFRSGRSGCLRDITLLRNDATSKINLQWTHGFIGGVRCCTILHKPLPTNLRNGALLCSIIEILLKYSLCGYKWIGSNKQLEYLDTFIRSMSLVFHFGWIWYQFLNYSEQKNWKFIPKLVSIIQSPNLRV